eukprot:CAMPEP_0173428220 /NCGR_PEP_ID=MMETSP1357-20121228/7217_1 /TAXON_ID=77926 /ORGANISM="Hemiselmis rufescens, Strain PCC563" /LENGTH=51 /DNA_ID=CAMNT_0014392195 /DNA_START=300 /DNA_END=452 /DNA_ORIENTATION=+
MPIDLQPCCQGTLPDQPVTKPGREFLLALTTAFAAPGFTNSFMTPPFGLTA